jgi:hypothetical protein
LYSTGRGSRLLDQDKDGVAMVRRIRWLTVLLASSVVTIAGCESLRQALRSTNDDKAVAATSGATSVESDPTKLQAVDADAKNPKPFFQNNRRSGGWSSEAREIESHMGVGP